MEKALAKQAWQPEFRFPEPMEKEAKYNHM